MKASGRWHRLDRRDGLVLCMKLDLTNWALSVELFDVEMKMYFF